MSATASLTILQKKGPKIAVTEGVPKGTFKIATLKKTSTVQVMEAEPPAESAGEDDPQRRDFQKKITALNSDIAKICRLAGTAGLSIGVLYKNRPLIYSSFGHRDIDLQLRTDQQTIYHIASVGKFITSFALGILVAEGKLKWEDPVKLHLPNDFRHWNKFVETKLRVLDCMTHQTGLVAQNRLWLAERARINFSPNETFTCFADLDALEPPGTSWRYSNWGYAIAGKLTEKLSGKIWGDFLQERIFDPLRLDCTITNSQMVFPNTASGYMPLRSGDLVLNDRPEAGDNCCMTGAFGIQSSVSDLLIFYKSLFTELSKPRSQRVPGPDLEMLTKRHVDLNIRTTGKEGKAEQSYSMGWVRTELPGVPSMNPRDTRIIGAAEDSTMLWHHNGNYPGFTAASYLLPETQSAVVVLCNSLGKIELSDTVAQMVVEVLLRSKEKGAPPIDWLGDAKEVVTAYDRVWSSLPLRLLVERPSTAKHLDLYDYCGKYYNSVKNWYMEFWYERETEEGPEALWMCMQGHKREMVQRYKLKHYYKDVFSWLQTYNESAYRGRAPIPNKEFYLLKFEVDDDLVVKALVWNSGDGDYLFPKEMPVSE